MSMTRGNAHQYLKKVYLTTKNDSYREALSVALTALRPVSREQVEKVWRGEWEHPGYYDDGGSFVHDCSKCNTPSTDEYWFCPSCGAPMTDEAVEMVVERLEALYETAE